MDTKTSRDEMLRTYHKGLRELLGDLLERVVLYGSHARDEAGPESDVDVLCVLHGPFNYGEMVARTSELTARLSLEYDIPLSRAFVTLEDYEARQLPFLMNVHKEGVVL